MSIFENLKRRAVRGAVGINETENQPQGALLDFLSYKRGTIQLLHVKGNLQVRQDSPKTKEACLALGYDAKDIFSFKTVDEFGGPGVPDHIKQIRYEHYVNKLRADITEVAKQRRSIIKNHQSLNNLDLIHQSNDMETSKIASGTAQRYQVKHADPHLVDEMVAAYTKTIGNFSSIQQIDPEEFHLQSLQSGRSENADPIEVLEMKLKKALTKYQRAQMHKTKELQGKLIDGSKKLQLTEELTRREKKIQNLKAQLQEQKLKEKKKHQLQQLEKMQKIKTNEKLFNEKLREERARQMEKLEKINQKQNTVEERKKQHQLEYGQKYKEKWEKTQKYKQKREEMENQSMNKTFVDIQNRLSLNSQRHRKLLQSKTDRLHQQSTEEEQKRQLILKQNTEQSESNFLSLVQRLVTKEEKLKQMEQSKLQEEESKRKQLREKEQKLAKLKNQLQEGETKRQHDLKEKFDKIQENSDKRKQQLQIKQEIKREKTRLKQKDLAQNFERFQRMKDLQFKRLIDQNLRFKQNAEISRLQDVLVRQAQQEMMKQQKIESEILDDSLANMTRQNNTKELETLQNFFQKNNSAVDLVKLRLVRTVKQTSKSHATLTMGHLNLKD